MLLRAAQRGGKLFRRASGVFYSIAQQLKFAQNVFQAYN